MGRKNLDALTVSETLFDRVELSYGADRLGLGNLPAQIAAATGGCDIDHSNVWLHSFNIRTLLVKENDCIFGIKAPAVTFGVSFKVNDGIESINHQLIDYPAGP